MRSDNQKANTNGYCLTKAFNFDEWKELNERDPELFDAKRDAWIEEFISAAPADYQANLNKIMQRVDAVKSKTDDPMESCLQISHMMMKSMGDLRYFLGDLKSSLQYKG
jgi:formylmethanofuran dehydrogenase subunit E-like metal-binding protein